MTMQYMMTTRYFVWEATSETSKRFLGVVDALGPVGAYIAAREQWGTKTFQIRKSKHGTIVREKA